MNIYQIIEVTYFHNDLQERYELATGMLDEISKRFDDWFHEHVLQYGGLEEWKKEYSESTVERVQLFLDDPQAWVDKYGDNEAELYSGWLVNHIYHNPNLVLKS